MLKKRLPTNSTTKTVFHKNIFKIRSAELPCRHAPKEQTLRLYGDKRDHNTKQPFWKKLLQVSGSAGASTLICLVGVSRGAAPNENTAINV